MSSRIDFKSSMLVVKQIDNRVVKQIFAVMGNIDEGGDRIMPGAFAKTIEERRGGIQVLWQHSGNEPPIGVPLVIKEIGRRDLPAAMLAKFPDALGALYAEVEYLDTPRGNEVLTGIQKGAIQQNSIGYVPILSDSETINGKRVRNLREVALFDLSPVNWAMNPATTNLKTAWLKDNPRVDEFIGFLEMKQRRQWSAGTAGLRRFSANELRQKYADLLAAFLGKHAPVTHVRLQKLQADVLSVFLARHAPIPRSRLMEQDIAVTRAKADLAAARNLTPAIKRAKSELARARRPS